MTAASASASAASPLPAAPVAGSPTRARSAAFRLLDATVTVVAARPAWADEVERLLAPFRIVAEAGETGDARVGGARGAGGPDLAATPFAVEDAPAIGPDGAVLRVDGRAVARGSWAAVLAGLLVELNARALASYRGFAVHAGVVASGTRVICFPGASGHGKSTMTAACLGAGFDYVSDEALCLEHGTGQVRPYPRPLALSLTGAALLHLPATSTAHRRGGASARTPITAGAADDRELLLTADQLGGRAVPADDASPLRLAHVVELRRGASEPHLEPRHRSLVVPTLLSMGFNHFKDPDAAVELVASLAGGVQLWRLHHDDPVEAAALVASRLR